MRWRGSTATLAAEAPLAAGGRTADQDPARSPTPLTAFRCALLLLCAVLSAVASTRTYAALPIAALAGLALAAERSEWARTHPLALAAAEAALAGLSVVLTGGSDSPMLPYLLAPPAVAGHVAGLTEVVLVSGTASAALLLGRLGAGPAALGPPDPGHEFVVVAAQWVALGVALGLLATRLRALVPAPPLERYAEVRRLLEQLRAESRRLPGGLDLAGAAETLLGDLERAAGSARSAVLVQPASGPLVPVAVRGTRRVPWRAPLSEPGPLQSAWTTCAPVVDRRDPDVDGRRRGSALAVLPLLSDGRPFGLVVVESFVPDAYPPPVLAALADTVQDSALRLETALLFEEVRSSVTVEERDRLARQMHDGVAQDLAFLGYRLDDLRMSAGRVDDALGRRVAELRGDLTRLISDLRLRITDLRSSLGTERGLGSALSSYVRAVGSGQRLTVHLSLEESPFRLPAEQEVLLLQVTQAVAQEVRRAGQADNLWVELVVDPPRARLVVEHDGPDTPLTGLEPLAERLHGTGRITVSGRPGPGVRVEALVEGGDDDDDDRDAGR